MKGITDKGHCTNEDYMLVENDDLIKDIKKISNLFNDFFSISLNAARAKKPWHPAKINH